MRTQERIELLLGVVDQNMGQLSGRHSTEETKAGAAYSQVYATCALVYAVRELTEAVRQLREAE